MSKGKIARGIIVFIAVLLPCSVVLHRLLDSRPSVVRVENAVPTPPPPVVSGSIEEGMVRAPGKTFRYWMPLNETASKILTDMNENRVYQEMERLSGVHIEFVHPPVGGESESLAEWIASGDLPDIIEYNDISQRYAGGVDQAIRDGVAVRLNEYIDAFAPHYKAVREANEEIRRLTTSQEGNIWGFLCIQTQEEMPQRGPIVRRDWLEDVGLDTPVTLEDWHEMLIRFRDRKGAKAPLLWPKNGLDDGALCFIGAYGITNGFCLKEGEVVFGPAEPEFLEFLEMARSWYAQGLIDPDFAQRDQAALDELVYADQAGAWVGSMWGMLNTYAYSEQKAEDVRFNVQAVPLPVKEAGSNRRVREKIAYVRGSDAVITNRCSDLETVVSWFDYRYTEEGYRLFNYGIEGENYDLWDGAVVYSDHKAENPEKLSGTILSWKYKMPSGTYWRNPQAGGAPRDRLIRAMRLWGEAGTQDVLPPVYLESGKRSVVNSITNDIGAIARKFSEAYIRGETDKREAYIADLRNKNLEEAKRIYKNALK